MTQVHPNAVVDGAAQLGQDVEVGPFCVIGPHVKIGDGEVGRYTRIFYDKLNAIMLKQEKDTHGWVVTLGSE